MAKRIHHKDIDEVLRHWSYSPDETRVRTVKTADGREVLQMRIELGVLQLEIAGRPDGEQPNGFESYLDYLLSKELHAGADLELNDEQCAEIDREFLQFYHRRICWLQLAEHGRAVEDADHTLGLMDFVRRHSPSEEWMLSHEQYRPFVLFHRTHAAARAMLDRSSGAEAAIGEINHGLQRMQTFFEQDDRFADVDFENLEIVQQLTEMRESLRDEHDVGQTLDEQLADAIADEKYELAAEIRDKIHRRDSPLN